MGATALAIPNIDKTALDLISTLATSPHVVLQPSPAITAGAVALVKNYLDPLAVDIADAQTLRRDENRRKRKRGDGEEVSVLRLRKVYTSGLGVKQVWEQARRILDATCFEVERSVESHNGLKNTAVNETEDENDLSDEEDAEEDLDDGEGMSILEDESDEIDDEEDDDDQGIEDDIGEEDIEDLDDEDVLSNDSTAEQEIYVPDPNGLNDGFFSIDDFNRKSQFLEQQDARGEDDNPSDEDEIDWDADPLTMTFSKPKGNGERDPEDKENEGGDDEEGGPTFGDANLNTDSDEDMEDGNADLDDAMSSLNNTNDIRYANFFEPPPKKPSKTKRMRALPKTQPPKKEASKAGEDLESDIQRAINDVNRDLFASDEEASEDESGSEGDASKNKNLSTHEKQRAKIAAEIRRLEAANVAKRDWTLSGEARAVDRPLNSLIEEDMEFERVGKPVPVITAEVSEEIEQLIKRRIIAREFDEVVRRHPDAIGNATETRRGRVELDDAKSQAGLAEIYEQDHLRATDPGYVDKRSAATKKQHAEIDRLWKEVSSQLDILSNLHFKPKRVQAEIKTVEDKPTISMEDARPVGAGGEESMLAPQEVYRPGETGKAGGEVTRKGGASVSKEEMTREEKMRKRRREKERSKKAGAQKQNQGALSEKKSKKDEKQDILTNLRKGNVKVIGKKGELQELGKQKRAHVEGISSSALKL